MSPRPGYLKLGLLGLLVTCLCILAPGCRRPGKPKPVVAAKPVPVEYLGYMKGTHVGKPVPAEPWICGLKKADLDKDGLMDVLVCEGKDSEVAWLRQSAPGVFEEKLIAKDMRAPVHAEAVDMDGDGDLDVLVASMGYVYPNNDKIGTIYILENDGRQRFTPRIVAENICRVTDVQAGDFNGDGKMDLAVVQFGYDQGEVNWFERTGTWTFKAHKLLDLSGGVNACVADFDRNATLDIAVLISQQWEEVYLLSNDGKGNFTKKLLYGSTNEDLGSSGMNMGDINQDGLMDLVFSAGDGFGPVGLPGPRPWHGVYMLVNQGGGKFTSKMVGDLGGAYCPVVTDLDGDGHNDVVAVSDFNDWTNPRSASLMWFRNDGKLNFEPRILANTPTHLLMLEVHDFNKSGKPQLITGAFIGHPPYDRKSRLMYWKRTAP